MIWNHKNGLIYILINIKITKCYLIQRIVTTILNTVRGNEKSQLWWVDRRQWF